ncbi:hypothetical protein E5082_22010 [Streptomyces griseoluteus]|uniref:Uncharacterized protein n=1 Tax=Streptomyces griseoluteus TaxID=29306 RepID=A0A4Z1DBI3_STRGP|nr:hypothetical protein [Streptomyces griseoluteus]TGN80087.1 hypothetical protein E5082_22010 [Streptomyces griseoluteus]GHE94352.1 hypothetical protein GCM10017776_08200 [Streptomyces griseoluteus]
MTTTTRSTRVLPTDELLAAADRLLNPSDETALSPGVRARAAATLLRLALDETLDAFWRAVSPRMTRSTGRTRMLCLQWYVSPSVARQWYTVWSGLSAACHYHTYDLPPTPAEVRAWHQDVSELLRVLTAARA